VFFSTFGSLVGTQTVPTTVLVDAQRSPAGSLSGGWSSTPTAGVVALTQGALSAGATAAGAGDATITFRDNRGPSGTFVLRSAPRFDQTGITGNTNTVSADCLDTTPPGTTSICTDNADIGLGQRTYRFTLTSTATGTPPVVSVSGSFTDGAFGGQVTISNAPTIGADGTFAPSGQVNGNYVRPGVFGPPRLPIPVTIRQDWTVTAGSRDTFTGTLAVLITPSGNRCGPNQTTVCTGNVTLRRTILTAQRQ
jgi:hypothetical protein